MTKNVKQEFELRYVFGRICIYIVYIFELYIYTYVNRIIYIEVETFEHVYMFQLLCACVFAINLKMLTLVLESKIFIVCKLTFGAENQSHSFDQF